MLCYSNLAQYYQTVFALAQHHKYQISEIENMVPFERDIYYGLLINYLQKREEQRRMNSYG